MKLLSSKEDWVNRARLSYQASTAYVEANLQDQWINNIRMFKNKHANGSKYNSELYQKRSRIFRPKVRTASMSFDAAVSTAFFSTSEAVRIAPENKKNPIAVAGASVVNDLVSYRLAKVIPWHRLVVAASQEAWKLGNVISHQGWEYAEDSSGNVIKDTSVITLIPINQFHFDPSADWLDPIASSPYKIWEDYMYVYAIKDRIRLGDKGKMAGWLPVTDEEILAARDGNWDLVRQERNPNGVDPHQENRPPLDDYDLIPVHKNFMNVDGQEWVYYTLSTERLLSIPVPVHEEYPQGCPFVLGSLIVESFTAYKPGVPELTQGIQEEINYMANDRLDNVHLVLNKRYFAKRGRNIDFRSLLRNIPGSITMMDDPAMDVNVVATPDITTSAYLEQDRLNLDFDELSGTFSSSTLQTNKQTPDSVGGLGMAQVSAGSVNEFFMRNFRESWVEPVIRQLAMLEMHYAPSDLVEAVVRDSEAVNLLRQTETGLEDLLQNLRLEVNVAISATNPQLRVERLLFGLGSLAKVSESPMASKLDMKEISTEVFGQLGYRDGTRFFTEGEDPKVAALEAQVQKLTQQLEGKSAEISARNQPALAKLQFEIAKYKNEQAQRDAEQKKTEAEAQKVVAEIQKILVDMEAAGQDVDDQYKLANLQLEYQKLQAKTTEFMTKDATARDKILADMMMHKEELAAKLKITLANSGQNSTKGVSNDTATVDVAELRSKDD